MLKVRCVIEDCLNINSGCCNLDEIEIDKFGRCMNYKINMEEIKKHLGNKRD